MSKVDDILNGWSNYLKGSDPTSLIKARERAEICVNCPQVKSGLHAAILPDYSIKKIRGMYCGECKCPLSTAVRSENYKCPKSKW